MKKALSDLTDALLNDPNVDSERKQKLKEAQDGQQFNKLCQLTGTKVIHVSERDTQVASIPKTPGEFVNTWSIAGFYEEGIAPVEIAWGTHEKYPPKGTHFHSTHIQSPFRHAVPGARSSQGHCIALSQPGMRSWGRSYVPEDGGDFIGILMPHGECITMSDCLTVYDEDGYKHAQAIFYRMLTYRCACRTEPSSLVLAVSLISNI